jgi:hypothetical protein
LAGTAGTEPAEAKDELRRRIIAGGSALVPSAEDFLKKERGTWIWREAGPDGRFRIVKLYRHRGFHNALRSRATRFRAQREWSRLRHLVRWDVPSVVPLGWTHGYSRDHGYFEALVTLEIPEAVPLDKYLKTDCHAASLAPLYRIVRRMHDSGLCSQTLYARNIVVQPGAPPDQRYSLLDLPRSWLFPGSIAGTSMARCDLLDLTRSIRLAGIAPGEIPVEAYARENEGGHRQALAKLPHRNHAFGKWSRKGREARTRLRWLLAWALYPFRPARLRDASHRSPTRPTQRE